MEAFAEELDEHLTGRPFPERKLVFLGLLHRHLPEDRRLVLVGGSAVELYTSGAYTSKDIDLVGPRDAARDLLVGAGFDEDPRGFEHPGYDLILDVSPEGLRPTEEVVEIAFEGVRFPVVTMEDVLVDRLLAAKFWESSVDWEQALVIYKALADEMDPDSLAAKAQANEVEDLLQELRETVRGSE